MLYRKLTAIIALTLCLTACGDNSNDIYYWDSDGNPITFSDTVGAGYEVSEAETIAYTETENTESEEDIEWDVAYIRPETIDKITDGIIRSDYAEYVSVRDGREISADDVHGVFNFGTENNYRILVMCPSEVHTDDIKTLHLQCVPLPEDDCDCYPFIDVELPSGSYEAFAYGHGRFYPLEEAIDDNLISYDMAMIISDYMVEYYGGDAECVYTVE